MLHTTSDQDMSAFQKWTKILDFGGGTQIKIEMSSLHTCILNYRNDLNNLTLYSLKYGKLKMINRLPDKREYIHGKFYKTTFQFQEIDAMQCVVDEHHK